MKALGGSFEVTSMPGEGTVATLTLPLERQTSAVAGTGGREAARVALVEAVARTGDGRSSAIRPCPFAWASEDSGGAG